MLGVFVTSCLNFGTSSKYQLKSVTTRRPVDVFVSRWDANTKSAEVAECVNDILQGKFTDSTVITPLKSKYEQPLCLMCCWKYSFARVQHNYIGK